MPLTCELGWHRADPLARWNDGYYFSKCTRCGRDLVRTAFQHWHVPKGFRVVWQAHPPATRKRTKPAPATEARMAEAPAAAAAAAHSPAAELPIQEVLRHLEGRDLSNDGGVGCEDSQAHPTSPKAPEDVHFGMVRVAEFRIDQLLVSDLIRPAPQDKAEEEITDPELPFEEASPEAEATAAAEAPLPVEEPVAEETQEPSPEAEAEAALAPEEAVVEETETPSPLPQAPALRSAFDDFMSDSPDPDFWDLGPRPSEPQRESRVDTDSIEGDDVLPAGAATEIPVFKAVAEDDYYEETPGFHPLDETPGFHHLDEGVDSIAPLDDESEPEFRDTIGKSERPSFLSVFTMRRKSSEEEEPPPAEATGPLSLSGQLAVASLLVAAGLMLASLFSRPPSDTAPEPQASSPLPVAPAPSQVAAKPKAQPPALTASAVRATNPPLFPARQKAFVTARILNCRASPVEQAGSVKKLSRGTEVEVLAREADWMSISHKGRQCWAAVRYISPDRPA